MDHQEERYNIRTLAQLVGLKPHTIRAWESRYNALEPARTEGGQRFYQKSDLDRLQILVRLQGLGHSISKIGHLSNPELEKFIKLNTQSEQRVEDSPAETQQFIHQILSKLNSYDLKGVATELEYARLNLNIRSFLLHVLSPVFQEVGIRCAHGQLSIAQEHAITAIAKNQLAQIYLPVPPEVTRTVALATPENNFHDIGIMIAEILCRLYRWKTVYLGSHLPAHGLAEALNALEVSNLILGVINVSDHSQDLVNKRTPAPVKLHDYLTELNHGLKIPVNIYLGAQAHYAGPSFNHLLIECLPTFYDLESFFKR
jgi:DNA-binding transcriptional MerR regulator